MKRWTSIVLTLCLVVTSWTFASGENPVQDAEPVESLRQEEIVEAQEEESSAQEVKEEVEAEATKTEEVKEESPEIQAEANEQTDTVEAAAQAETDTAPVKEKEGQEDLESETEIKQEQETEEEVNAPLKEKEEIAEPVMLQEAPAVVEEEEEIAEPVMLQEAPAVIEEEEIEEVEVAEGGLLEYSPGADIVSSLKVQNPTATTLKLVWTTPAGGADGYEMSVSKSADFSSPTIRDTTNTYYDVTGLICGLTYYYRVRAYLLDSGVKAYGEYRTIEYRTSPSAPTSLSATQEGAVSVRLNWSTVSEADGYYIVFGTSDLATITSQTTTTYLHANLDTFEDLTYRVYSYKNVSPNKIRSADYAEAKIEKLIVPAPTNLTATSVGNDSVKLTWDAMEGVAYYQIRRRAGTEFENLTQVTTNTYTDTGLLFGKEYAYTVTAYLSASYYSDPSAPVLGLATGAAPGNVKAESSGTDSIKISWDAVSNANGYRVEAASSKTGPWTSIYEDVNTNYTETGLSLGDGRYYRVSAYVFSNGTKVYGGASDVVFAAVKPIAPKVKVENNDYNKQMVTWDDLGPSVKYEFNLSTNSSFSNPVIRNTSNAYYPVTGCTNGVVYYYRVRGYVELDGGKTLVYGPYSETVSLQSAPSMPASVTVTSLGWNDVKISWPAVNGATSYMVYSKKDDGAWQQIGTATAPTLEYTVKGLGVGSKYFFGVSAVRTANGVNAVSKRAESSEYDVNINNFTPVEFTDTALSTTSIRVDWKKFTGITTYEVEGKSSDDSTFSLEQTVNTNSITLTGLKNGYEYQIRARSKVTVNDQDLYSPWSMYYTVQARAMGPATLRLTSAYAAYAVSVDWSVTSGADGYIIERAQYKEGPYTLIKDIGDGTVKHYGDYNFSSADVGKTFFYRVCSYINAMGSKQKSSYATAQVLLTMPRPTVTAAPQNMGRINLTWTDVGADYYQVQRSTSSSSGYTVIATTSTTSYSDAGSLIFGNVYYYRVRGYKNVSGTMVIGYLSNVVSAEPKTMAPTITGCSANGGSVKVNWSKAPGATSYNVYYHEDGGNWKLAGNTNKLTYTVSGLLPETKYFFKVASVAGAKNGRTVEGLFSAETSITTVATVVGSVSGMKATPNNLTSIALTWNKVADATGYEVQIATYIVSTAGRGPWHDWTSSTTNKATVGSLLKNKTYWIRIRAYVDEGGIKSYGAWTPAFTGYSAPVAPGGLTVKSTTSTSATLTWSPVSGAAGYRILYGTNKNSLAVYTDVLNPSLSEFTVAGLSSGTTYYFRVQAFGSEAADRRLYGNGSTVANGKTK